MRNKNTLFYCCLLLNYSGKTFSISEAVEGKKSHFIFSTVIWAAYEHGEAAGGSQGMEAYPDPDVNRTTGRRVVLFGFFSLSKQVLAKSSQC